MNNNQETNETTKVFNPREHLMQIKSRDKSSDYLPVCWRLVWFREAYPHGAIETEMIHLDLDKVIEKEVFAWNNEKRRSEKILKTGKGIAIFKATVRDGKGGEATSTGSECAIDFDDFIEKAETKAIGRALAALGYGTQFAPELDEAHRIVDAPVDRTPTSTTNNNGNNNRSETDEGTITDQQVASIKKLCLHLGKSEPDNITKLSFLAAKKSIQTLTTEYKERQANKSA